MLDESPLTDAEIINYINEYYYNVFVLGIDPFRNCNLPRDEED